MCEAESERVREGERASPVCGMEEFVGGGTVDLFTYVTPLLTHSALLMYIQRPLTATPGRFSDFKLSFQNDFQHSFAHSGDNGACDSDTQGVATQRYDCHCLPVFTFTQKHTG